MFVKQEIYGGKLTDILYAEKGYVLEDKKTLLLYGSVSLEEGRTQDNYREVEAEDDEGIS